MHFAVKQIGKYFVGGILLLSFLVLTACGSEKTTGFADIDMNEITLDVEAMADNLLNEVQFDDTLVEVDAEIAEAIYGIKGLYTAVSAHASTGATAEVLLLLSCDSAEQAAAAEDKLAAYRDDMADVYAGYNMKESGKLQDALLASYGKYVVFIVSPDTSLARESFEAYVVETQGK